MYSILAFVLFLSSLVSAQTDKCPRPEEIAPCQCRTRGPTIQVRCTNSMMGRITEAMSMLRRRVTEVDVLILEDNFIPHLPSRAFGSVKINRLFMENNRMMTIDRNAFAGIEDFLTELYIKEPQLKSLPKDSIDFLRYLTVFSVENSQIMTMPKVVGLKNLKLFKIDGSNIREINTLNDLPSLRYLHITRSNLVRLDISILEDLRHLILANFTDNQINWIHPRAFRYMEQLEEVVLKGNEIKDASNIGRAMRVVKPLKSLDLSHNEIEKLDENSFVDIINLEELNLSQNRLTDLRRAALHRMPSLKSVDLSHNQIRNFHSDSFMDTPKIESLKLNHNDLTEISDVSFVMDALPQLRVLDLSFNNIRDIPYGALRGYPALERLFLASNQISRVSLQALADMPSLTELDLSHNKLIADAIDGPIFDLPNLKILNLSHNKLSILNDQLLTTLNRLKRLDVSHNGISVISESALTGVNQLDYLNISYNNLREFKPETFKELSQLFELDASHNELVALPDYLLVNQKNLEYVSFAFNQLQLISMHLLAKINRVKHLDLTSNFIMGFPEALITGLPNLEKLLFRRNSLQKLSRRSFKGLNKLEVLDLHDNRIQEIQEDAFMDLKNLKGLDLSLNIISTVGDTLEPLQNLMKLNLSDNYITSLPRNAFHSLEKLSTLDVSNNTIVEIGSAFTSMPQLKYLDISYNHLPMIKKGNFKDLPNLVGLRLDFNSIIDLQAESFQDLWALETLILTKNGIPRIHSDTFRNLPSLEKLQLDDNLIEKLERRSFSDLFSLKEIHLQQNIIQYIDDQAFLRVPSVRHFNISYNLLEEIPRSGFYGLDTLETLDLSFNDLRGVDASLFDNQKWLVELKLNDNNICRINRYAFRETSSLRSLSLKNNRLTRLPQEAFEIVKNQIMQFDVAGNPLTCDCETLWLRNWASDEKNVIQDDPICYFPPQLSGNPLRQLRTSRFTCGARSSDFIGDACRGIPVKTPVQQHIRQGLESGIFNTALATNEDDVLEVSTRPLLKPQTEATELKTAEPEDIDVIDTDTDSTTEYEYYYVYYDEAGNMIDKTAPLNKVQEGAALNLAESTSANVDNNIQAGDTPTIYASLSESESEKSAEDLKEAEDDEGLSIFGIPIPKIPFPILSFGLAPTTLSHGLLPIGRKGEPEQNRRKTEQESYKLPEITRGPDAIDPIWIESLVNAGKAYFSSSEEDLENSENSDYYPNTSGYIEPENPVIPLVNSEETGYFPQHVPALKFDHPIDHNIYATNQPIQPVPELVQSNHKIGPQFDQIRPQVGQKNNPEEGFMPLFMPDKADPVRQYQGLPAEGFTLPYYLQNNYPLTYRKPPQQLPDEEFPIVYAQNQNNGKPEEQQLTLQDQQLIDYQTALQQEEKQLKITRPEVQQLNYQKEASEEYKKVTFPAVPKKLPGFEDKSTTTEKVEANLEDEYYYVYEDVPVNYQETPKTSEEIMQYLNNFANVEVSSKPEQVLTTTASTDRKVPTLKVEEIFPGKTTLKKPDLSTTTTTTESTTSAEKLEEIETTPKPKQEVVYEYEYYYEYYDDPEEPQIKREVDNSDYETTQKPIEAETTQSSFSLQNFLNLLTNQEDEKLSTTEVTISTLGNTGEILNPKFKTSTRPTLALPMRTSTEVSDYNYLENQRSTVGIETTHPKLRLTPSTPVYPFYPDRLDPRNTKPNHDNEVKWYYSNYHSENLEPFVDPRFPREEAAHVEPSSSVGRHFSNVLLVIFLSLFI